MTTADTTRTCALCWLDQEIEFACDEFEKFPDELSAGIDELLGSPASNNR